MAQVAPPPRPLGDAADADADADAARRFLPPPGVHPNGAVFGAARLPKPLTWQRREHMVQRRSILGRIGQLLARNAQLVVRDGDASDASAKTWALARKLEVLIFLNSASLLEYNNVDSLARRVQAMTASIVNKKIRRETVGAPQAPAPQLPPQPPVPQVRLPPVATVQSPSLLPPPSLPLPLPPAPPLHQSFTEMMRSAALPPPRDVMPVAPAQAAQPMTSSAALLPRPRLPVPGNSGGGKRSASEMMQMAVPPTMAALSTAPVNPVQTALNPTKRPRLQQHQLPPSPAARASGRLGQLLFQGVDELPKMIWSYVDGAQIMRSRAVSRAARVLAPLLVTSLQLSCNATLLALNTFSAATGACVLRECENVKELEVVSLSSGMSFGKRSMRAMNCPQRFVVTHDDHEQIVLALSQQLRYNAFPRLSRLGLTCLFTNEEADGEADVLLNNLMTGCCPQLEELCLPGNSFGDYGAIKIAQMLRAGVCPKLTRLDLRRNFISEEGIRSVCHALADGCAPDLVELCLGGNTITDSCFHHVLFAMESRKLPRLRFLGIEMNYLTATSMEMLGRTIGKMVCPVLSQISYSDNSVDNADAKRLIATAVYQERMFRMRQQQLRHQQRLSSQRQQQQQQEQPQRPPMAAHPQQPYPQQYQQPTHATMFPYTHEFSPASSLRGSGTSVAGSSAGSTTGGAYFSEAPYSSGDDDDDDEPYSSDDE